MYFPIDLVSIFVIVVSIFVIVVLIFVIVILIFVIVLSIFVIIVLIFVIVILIFVIIVLIFVIVILILVIVVSIFVITVSIFQIHKRKKGIDKAFLLNGNKYYHCMYNLESFPFKRNFKVYKCKPSFSNDTITTILCITSFVYGR